MHNRITAKGKGVAEILIYDTIGEDWWTGEGVTAKGFMAALKTAGDVETIILRINSPGGSVTEGAAIYDSLVRHKARKVVHIDGLAASMATQIAMVGDEIHMAANALFMIHEPLTAVMGNADELLAQATILEAVATTLVKTYAARTGRDEAVIRAEMKAETWFTAEQAKEAGYVTHIGPRKELSAHFDPVASFAKAPAWVQSRLAEFRGGIMPDTATPAPPETKAPEAVAAPVATVDVEAITAHAKAQQSATASSILAMCSKAGLQAMAATLVADASMTVDKAREKILDALCEKNPPVGDDVTATPDKPSGGPNAKYEAEYKADAGNQSLSLDQYISLRRFQDGLEPLIPTKAV